MADYNYKDHGFKIIKNAINIKLINRLQEEIDFCFKSEIKNFSNISDTIIELDKKNKSLLYEIVLNSSKLQIFNEISNEIQPYYKELAETDKPIIELSSGYLIGIPFSNRVTYDFHQESNYWTNYNYDVVTAHYAISNLLNYDNGSMSVLVGSHKLKTLDFKDPIIKPQHTKSLVPVDIEKHKVSFEEITFELEKGDCAFFHKDLIHRSNMNKTDAVRFAGIIRYAQEFKLTK